MANHFSAIKRTRTIERRTAVNRMRKSRMRHAIRSLRRLLEKRGKDVMDLTAGEAMTSSPKTIAKNEFAATAIAIMEERKITSLMVVDSESRLLGIVHLHDLWGTEMV